MRTERQQMFQNTFRKVLVHCTAYIQDFLYDTKALPSKFEHIDHDEDIMQFIQKVRLKRLCDLDILSLCKAENTSKAAMAAGYGNAAFPSPPVPRRLTIQDFSNRETPLLEHQQTETLLQNLVVRFDNFEPQYRRMVPTEQVRQALSSLGTLPHTPKARLSEVFECPETVE